MFILRGYALNERSSGFVHKVQSTNRIDDQYHGDHLIKRMVVVSFVIHYIQYRSLV